MPSALPKRLLAPSATTVYAARISIDEPSSRGDVGAVHEPAVDDRGSGVVAAEHGGPGLDGAVDEQLVEPFTRCHEGVVRVQVVGGPAGGGTAGAGGEADVADAVELAEPAVGDAAAIEGDDRAWGDQLPARLLAGCGGAIDDDDAVPVVGQRGGDRCSCRTGSDDEDVDRLVGCGHGTGFTRWRARRVASREPARYRSG